MKRQEQETVTETPSTASVNSNASLLKPIRQLIVFILGISVLLVGIAMLVLPGPGLVVIPAGLAILATEFIWARRWLNYLKKRAQDVAEWTMTTATVESTRSPQATDQDGPADSAPPAAQP